MVVAGLQGRNRREGVAFQGFWVFACYGVTVGSKALSLGIMVMGNG